MAFSRGDCHDGVLRQGCLRATVVQEAETLLEDSQQ